MPKHPVILSLALLSCTSPEAVDPQPSPGARVSCGAACEDAALRAIQKELADTRALSSAELLARYPAPGAAALGYDPGAAVNLDRVQGSALRLNDEELAVYRRQGLEQLQRQRFPSFLHGYETLYFAHMPLYITADSILHAVHRSYDQILMELEQGVMAGELRELLGALRGRVAAGALQEFGPVVQGDADRYLTVALSLLEGQLQAPARADQRATLAVAELYQKALDGRGVEKVVLFGEPREFDFSQFKPRGHYAGDAQLERYFRAMMWLGRVELRLVAPDEQGALRFRRGEFEATLALQRLFDGASLARWRRHSAVVAAFVGDQDNLTVEQVAPLLAAIGARDLQGTRALTDEAIAQALLRTDLGTQRIASQVLRGGLRGTAPLARSFYLLGQRYVVDSHVLSNLVYDRVQGGQLKRMMPSSLDVAFAALGNNQAAQLLQGELQRYPYAPDLHAMRFLVDQHGEGFWGQNLYSLWLAALRALSPDVNDQEGLPQLLRSERWGRRVLGGQLASWAELRHDTLLYAKPSYSSVPICEFPDAYVDPYPRFYGALTRYAQRGYDLVDLLGKERPLPRAQDLQAYFLNLRDAAATLKEMAEFERRGQPLTDAHMRFVNETVRIELGCTSKEWKAGWFLKLYYARLSANEYDPTVADVHTQPADEGGSPVGKVLHVGTGMPRMMVVALDTCRGPRAYVGLSSAYYEHTTTGFQRLSDDEWAQQLMRQPPAEVPFLKDLMTP